MFPNAPGDYSVTDSTTPSGTGTVTAGLSGGGTNNVTFTVPNTINSGDTLTFTVLGVINPSVASSTYQINVVGNVTGPGAAAALPPRQRHLSQRGHNHLLRDQLRLRRRPGVQRRQLSARRLAEGGQGPDPSRPRPGPTAPTSADPQGGYADVHPPDRRRATIYVVGTDGELHGFATPKQFGDGGYNGALVVTVTNLGGLKIGATEGAEGATGNALGTSADGAISSSTGPTTTPSPAGRAFNIQTGAQLSTIKKTNKSTIIKGTVSSAQKSASVATGALMTVAGPVYVTYQGQVWPFKSMTQLNTDGYGGTAAVPVPSTGG